MIDTVASDNTTSQQQSERERVQPEAYDNTTTAQCDKSASGQQLLLLP